MPCSFRIYHLKHVFLPIIAIMSMLHPVRSIESKGTPRRTVAAGRSPEGMVEKADTRQLQSISRC